MHLKIPSVKWCSFHSGGDELTMVKHPPKHSKNSYVRWYHNRSSSFEHYITIPRVNKPSWANRRSSAKKAINNCFGFFFLYRYMKIYLNSMAPEKSEKCFELIFMIDHEQFNWKLTLFFMILLITTLDQAEPMMTHIYDTITRPHLS